MDDTVTDDEYEEVFYEVAVWQQRWKEPRKPFLRFRKAWTTIAIEDGRNCEFRSFSYHDGAAALYEYCADAHTRADIDARFGGESWVEDALNEFVSKDLMIFLDSRYLSLALPENPYF
jgi:hypothetical protein